MASAARVHNVAEAKARVTLKPDGTAMVETDMTDIGTGTYTILGQIAGEMLGLDPKDVLVELGDTEFPRGPGSGGSWGAASIGSAVYVACKALREKLAERLGVRRGRPDAEGRIAIEVTAHCNRATCWMASRSQDRALSSPARSRTKLFPASFGAFFAEVAVNRFTGETRVHRMTGAFGFGRVLNEKTARSQCLGGMTWSIGAALTEALHVRSARRPSRQLRPCRIPRAGEPRRAAISKCSWSKNATLRPARSRPRASANWACAAGRGPSPTRSTTLAARGCTASR